VQRQCRLERIVRYRIKHVLAETVSPAALDKETRTKSLDTCTHHQTVKLGVAMDLHHEEVKSWTLSDI